MFALFGLILPRKAFVNQHKIQLPQPSFAKKSSGFAKFRKVLWSMLINSELGFSKIQSSCRKADFLQKIRQIREKRWIWGLGVWGAICIVNIIERIAQKLRRIILLHFGLVTFRIHVGKISENLAFLCFSDLADVTMIPNTIFFISGGTRILHIIQTNLFI